MMTSSTVFFAFVAVFVIGYVIWSKVSKGDEQTGTPYVDTNENSQKLDFGGEIPTDIPYWEDNSKPRDPNGYISVNGD